jgi:tRNA threonylcarbamoyladenosine biosynthesis protein TsaE
MEKRYLCSSLEELDPIAGAILDECPGPGVYALFGEMGSGKTTLIKRFCRALAVTDVVTSPTFALVNEYQTPDAGPVYHFDVYRIRKVEEVMDIGYEAYFYSGQYVFVEWADKITELLPGNYVNIRIRETEDGSREILVKW